MRMSIAQSQNISSLSADANPRNDQRTRQALLGFAPSLALHILNGNKGVTARQQESTYTALLGAIDSSGNPRHFVNSGLVSHKLGDSFQKSTRRTTQDQDAMGSGHENADTEAMNLSFYPRHPANCITAHGIAQSNDEPRPELESDSVDSAHRVSPSHTSGGLLKTTWVAVGSHDQRLKRGQAM
ncbi:MAG: hypothetical protein M1817_001893 [Caeruleum heppii]|nr:MAG: hypothetical protein M1817_001893 [Caeruleum heppii]